MTFDLFLKGIGKNLSALRKSKSILQSEASSLSGISYRYYQNIEAGRANITLSTFFKLTKLLDVHPCDLLPERQEEGPRE
jgi:transcriptional regulator with XRE-family HTH domain